MNSNKPALYIPALGGIYSSLDGLAAPLLRVVVGLSLMPHGAQKLFGMFGGGAFREPRNSSKIPATRRPFSGSSSSVSPSWSAGLP